MMIKTGVPEGILLIFISLLCTFWSYRAYKAQKYSLCLSMIIFTGFILNIFMSFDLFLHPWDERYHALVAKHLIDDPWKPLLYLDPLLPYDYRSWATNHIWVHKQPIPLYSMALSMLFFGKNVLALRVPSILLAGLNVYFIYRLSILFFRPSVGLLAAFLMAINGLILELLSGRVATDHIDLFFMSFVLYSTYFALYFAKFKGYKFLLTSGLFLGLAILSKWLPALIVLPVFSLGWIHFQGLKLKQLWAYGALLLFIAILIFLPWQWYIFSAFPRVASWEYTYNAKHIFEALGDHAQPFYYHFDKMRIIFGELVYLPMIWLIYKAFTKGNHALYGMLLVWIFVPYLFFSFAVTKMQGYIMFSAPAIFIVISLFVHSLLSTKVPTKYQKLVYLMAALLILLPIRYTFERVKPFEERQRVKPWIAQIETIEKEYIGLPVVVFNVQHPIEIMFHTDMIAYTSLPTQNQIQSIYHKGYTILINDDNINAHFSDYDFIRYIHLME